MRNLFFACVVCGAMMAMEASASAQCGYRSYGYHTYYRAAPVVVVPSYGYGPGYYGYGVYGQPWYGYRTSYYGGFPAYRTYYRGGGYGFGGVYPPGGISINLGGW